MELYDVTGNDTTTADGTAGGALAAATVTADGGVTVYLTDEQFQTLTGETVFQDITIETAIGLFTGSIAVGFALASLVLVIKLAFGALRKLLQRI